MVRPGPRPRIQPGLPITEYSQRELVDIAAWVESDEVPRTEDEVVAEMMIVLGFHRRGSRIVTALSQAIRTARHRRSQ